MRYGRSVEKGFLPVYSVADEEEAESLINLACPRDDNGVHYSRELVHEQTLDNLQRFSDKLHNLHEVLKEKGHCRCVAGSV